MKQNKYVIVLTTVETELQAENLANKIIENKLAACVQIQQVKSFYQWNDKVERANEYFLMIKTQTALFVEISEFIKQNHEYQIPEIVQIPITDGSTEYLKWIGIVTMR